MTLTRDPVFLAGLAIRLALITLFLPVIHTQWFAPFLLHAGDHASLDPWTSFLAGGGDPQAFPYGLVYLVAYVPGAMLGDLIAGLPGALVALSLTTLALDTALYALLRKLADPVDRVRASAFYWLSPITLYIGYWHGQLDVLPVLLLTAGFLFLRVNRFRWAAYLLGFAVAAKASMVVAVPFILIYFLGSSRLRREVPSFILPFSFTAFALIVPFYFQPGFREMVLSTPEFAKATEISVQYGQDLSLFIFPIILASLLLIAWRVRKLNFDAVVAFTGAAFLLLYCLTPASPGWALWFAPFLSLHMAKAEGWRTRLLFVAFTTTFVVFHLLTSTGPVLRITGAPITPPAMLDALPLDGAASWILSGLVLLGLVILAQLLRERVFGGRFYRATRRPVLISIAGDSGTGKDTLSDVIVDMVGGASSTTISGDDYHIWDRHKPMWRALTHLNPKANHLDKFVADIRDLAANKPVRMRHYDHSVGRMTKPFDARPADTIVVSGLHALYPQALVEMADLRVFLDMDEGLRRFLKIRRDVTKRGHPLDKVLAALERREADRNRFILPQADQADLVLSLSAVRDEDIADPSRNPGDLALKLRLISRRAEDFSRLTEVLVSVCGVFLVERRGSDHSAELVVEGHPSPQDVAIAARFIAPELDEHLSLTPRWHGGVNGLLQLAMLDQMARIADSRAGGHS